MWRLTVVTHHRVLALVGVLALMSVAGCSDTEHGHRVGQGNRPASVQPSVGSPGGANSINCGRFKRINGPHPGGVTDAGWSCFADAIRERRIAILHLTQTTTEGDPVYVTFTSRSDGRVDVVTDSSHDRFGSSGIQRQTCWDLDQRPVAKRVLFFKECTTSS